nr:MAG TPA: hypothetical protein [Bacteriophage sp.]
MNTLPLSKTTNRPSRFKTILSCCTVSCISSNYSSIYKYTNIHHIM